MDWHDFKVMGIYAIIVFVFLLIVGEYGIAIVALIGYTIYGLISSIKNSVGGDKLTRFEKRYIKTYKAFVKKHPDIIDEVVQEYMIRRIIFWKHNLTCLALFVLGSAGTFLAGKKMGENSFFSILGLVSLVLTIVAVITFAKGLHDPLTPNEAKELIEKEQKEKNK